MSTSSALTLRYWPDPVLRTVCTEVTDKQRALENGKEMIRIMFQHGGVGLAAPQVGLTERIFVMRDPESHSQGLIFINPEIVEYQKGEVETIGEGCLSFPGQKVRICRPRIIDIEFDSPDKEERLTWHFEAMNARCCLHEIDHLKGVMIFDHIMSPLMRKLAMEKYAKYRRKM